MKLAVAEIQIPAIKPVDNAQIILNPEGVVIAGLNTLEQKILEGAVVVDVIIHSMTPTKLKNSV